MSKDSNTQHRTTRQHLPTKIIVERHYVGTEKMETVFKRIAEEQVIKKVKVTVHSATSNACTETAKQRFRAGCPRVCHAKNA